MLHALLSTTIVPALLAQGGPGPDTTNAEGTPETTLERARREAENIDWTDPEQVWAFAIDVGLPLLGNLVGGLAILIIAWLVANFIARLIRGRAEKSKHFDTTVGRFLANIAKWAILLLGFIAALGTIGIKMIAFTAVLAAAGFAVGLALQGSLSNFAAGIMLLVFRPFKVGDVVNVGGETGIVDSVDLFTTTLDRFDNKRLIIPNSNIFGNTIENITHHPIRRADIPVGTDYGADLNKVREVLEQAAKSVEGQSADREPIVILDTFGDSSINWLVCVWAPQEDWLAIKQRTMVQVKRHLDEANIGIPFPQRDVHLFKAHDHHD